MLYVRQWGPHEKQICGFFSIPKHMLTSFFVKVEKRTERKKFCQNYIFADSGRTLCKRLTGEYFLKGNL